jgi:DNA-binding winged helix-turn-helix (wHTH) protein/TolB-like protein/Flp pilus assembly protein TadD
MTSSSSDDSSTIYVFDGYRLDTARRLLQTQYGETIPLASKAFETLLYFVTNAGRVIEKDELMSSIWPDAFVEENNLNKNVSILRRVLKDDRRNHRFLVTVPGQGYKFVAEVSRSESVSTAAVDSDGEKSAAIADKKTSGPLVAMLLVAGLVIAGLAAYFWNRSPGPRPAHAATTVAVLPFRPIVAEQRDEALELGMAEALIAGLSENRALTVRPLSSVRGFNRLDGDALTAGRKLSVDYVVEGSIQRWGDKIRVTVGLLSVADGSVLWSEAFDEKFTDIFGIQDTISTRATSALSPRISNDAGFVTRGRRTNDPDAYAHYLRARYFAFKITEADIRKAIDLYERAIAVDPNYSLAYAGMADAYRTLAVASYAPGSEVCPKAKELAEHALSIDDSLAEAHIVLGWINLLYTWDWPRAEKELRRAIELSPQDSEAHRAYGHLLSNSGRHDEAIEEGRIASELAPLVLITATLEVQYLSYAGRYDDALALAGRTMELDPDFWVIHNVIGRIYLKQNRFPEAFAELRRAIELSHDSPEPWMQLGYGYGVANNREEALKTIGRLEQLSSERFVPSYSFALVYNGLGETETSLDYLAKSYEAHDTQLAFIKVDSRWNNIRREPRFMELVNRMGIEH